MAHDLGKDKSSVTNSEFPCELGRSFFLFSMKNQVMNDHFLSELRNSRPVLRENPKLRG